ncbi:MAG: phosphoribosylformylglycinamidine synthase subunit PurQ [Candidatus Cloacimonetes bacterium]|nr:phosphoribosylformylglycinamidine synthase subunit PurQ [Candidatus Cloacimonadota bacterium]MDY0337509.1 phosphoribosylformylglycinamidine synthase subunit PurQ [Candidatus Cloacimonadaceae bacterium]MCB5270026.1 phosphoribosylformylglycinamidine synthase subunit PurQ [Candidatus Cloacimonadota bacterium]MCK9334604.1 phosphoribosylformylglycinamidine synthase subunit PurQ [Candidatus Cloacimonadota bacterium]MDD2544143.1 phosphoribosylformylglycinamidine synthase subunit PurQ [Candidatus Cl
MRVSVITFPGSNCDHDAYEVFKSRAHDAKLIWHKDHDLEDPDLVILPGGFSYGDYLRCGALARFSPIVNEVLAFANRGGLVMGICNGFQILTETGLLPGTLLMNSDLKFICKHQFIRVETSNSPFSKGIEPGTILDIPIAHKEGNYFIDESGLNSLQDNDQVLFRYCDVQGEYQDNPNGAIDNIAGIINTKRNVLGMMPHPERAATDSVSSQDGRKIFQALERYFDGRN